MNQQAIETLSQLQADAHVMFTKLHNFHWHVRGPQFYALHEKTQLAYELFAQIYDDLAERIIQLGGTPLVTLSTILETTKIKETDKVKFTANELITHMLEDYDYLLTQFKNLAKKSHNDTTTSAYAEEKIALFEKEIWMLKAHLD